MHRSLVRLLPIVALVGMAWTATACSPSSGRPNADYTGARLPTSATALPPFTPEQFQILLKQLRGTPVVVNVWASWCGPCIAEAPGLAALSKKYSGKVQFIGVDIEDAATPARKFIQKYGWTYPSVADPQGEIRNSLGLVGQPVTYVFDSSGKQVFAQAGPVGKQALDDELSKLA